MNNLQKFSRLAQFFASCDWNHNNNKCDIVAFDNGFNVIIEFDYYREDLLKVNFDYKFSSETFSIQFEENKYILNAFTFDFEKLDELLGKIFSEVVLTDMETLEVDYKINSDDRPKENVKPFISREDGGKLRK